MNIENYTNNITDLQKQWQKEHQEKGLSKFIFDGIVNETFWNESNKKIMFFLKEAYILGDDLEGNLCKSLNKWYIWKMWWVVSDWVYALNNVTLESIPAYYNFDYNDHWEATKRVRSISVVNVKKSEGKPNSEFDDLMGFVKNDKEYIAKQVEEINPEIIVCGNTDYYFEYVFEAELDKKGRIISNATYNGYEVDHNKFKEKGFAWAGNTLIIDYCHPANHFNRQGKYYALAALYQQALKEKQKENNL